MKWSLSLGKVKGIRILVHWTFLLLIGWIIFAELGRGRDWGTILLTIGFVLTIFACVVLHELGHALTAKRYGIDTNKITLLPIGGVASLERIPEDPKKELMIAVAGPLVNVGIALILYVYLTLTGTFSRALEGDAMAQGMISGENFVFSLFVVNVILVVFNAIPAFPMDGGRVLRALLAMRMNRVRATQIAANLGQLVALGFAFLGILYNPFLIFIGVFVFFGAYTENMIVQYLELLKGYKVRDAMITNFSTLSPEDTVQDALDKLIAGTEHDFIVSDNTGIVGVVTRENILNSLRENGNKTATVHNIMKTDFEVYHVDDKLSHVYTEAQRGKEAFFPVMDGERIAGIINRDNLNEFVMIKSAQN